MYTRQPPGNNMNFEVEESFMPDNETVAQRAAVARGRLAARRQAAANAAGAAEIIAALRPAGAAAASSNYPNWGPPRSLPKMLSKSFAARNTARNTARNNSNRDYVNKGATSLNKLIGQINIRNKNVSRKRPRPSYINNNTNFKPSKLHKTSKFRPKFKPRLTNRLKRGRISHPRNTHRRA